MCIIPFSYSNTPWCSLFSYIRGFLSLPVFSGPAHIFFEVLFYNPNFLLYFWPFWLMEAYASGAIDNTKLNEELLYYIGQTEKSKNFISSKSYFSEDSRNSLKASSNNLFLQGFLGDTISITKTRIQLLWAWKLDSPFVFIGMQGP